MRGVGAGASGGGGGGGGGLLSRGGGGGGGGGSVSVLPSSSSKANGKKGSVPNLDRRASKLGGDMGPNNNNSNNNNSRRISNATNEVNAPPGRFREIHSHVWCV